MQLCASEIEQFEIRLQTSDSAKEIGEKYLH